MTPTGNPLSEGERDAPSGQIHTCSGCGKQETWGPTWIWYGSLREWDEGKPIYKACSVACMEIRETVAKRERELAALETLRCEAEDAERRLASLRAQIAVRSGDT